MKDGKDVGQEGRVGICTQGGAEGSHVLLIREAAPGWWTLYVEPPPEGFDFDTYLSSDEQLEELLGRWGVEWLCSRSGQSC